MRKIFLLFVILFSACDSPDIKGELHLRKVIVKSGKAHSSFVQPTTTRIYYVPADIPITSIEVDTTFRIDGVFRDSWVRYVITPTDSIFSFSVPLSKRKSMLEITLDAPHVETPARIRIKGKIGLRTLMVLPRSVKAGWRVKPIRRRKRW